MARNYKYEHSDEDDMGACSTLVARASNLYGINGFGRRMNIFRKRNHNSVDYNKVVTFSDDRCNVDTTEDAKAYNCALPSIDLEEWVTVDDGTAGESRKKKYWRRKKDRALTFIRKRKCSGKRNANIPVVKLTDSYTCSSALSYDTGCNTRDENPELFEKTKNPPPVPTKRESIPQIPQDPKLLGAIPKRDMSRITFETKSVKQGGREPVCWICHKGSQPNRLFRVCSCVGWKKLVHMRCLERWLTSTGAKNCESCGYTFQTVKVLRNGLFSSFVSWVNYENNLMQLIKDALSLFVLTPLAALADFVQLDALDVRLHSPSVTWTMVFSRIVCGLSLAIYYSWVTGMARNHLENWYAWWRNSYEISVSPDHVEEFVEEEGNSKCSGYQIPTTDSDITVDFKTDLN